MRNFVRKMLLLILNSLTFTISNAIAASPPSANFQIQQAISREYTLPSFNGININGPVKVEIFAGYSQPQIKFFANNNVAISQINAAVRDKILYLSPHSATDATAQNTSAINHTPTVIQVYVPQINLLRASNGSYIIGRNLSGPINIDTSGNGTLLLQGHAINLRYLKTNGAFSMNIAGINSPLLTIDFNGGSSIRLQGEMALQTLNFNGNGNLSAEWINSPKISINGTGNGHIFLAGKAGELGVTLNNHAYLDAKYLRAQKGFINTADKARADVSIKNTINTLATGNSNIFYYRDSEFASTYMEPRGASLRTANLPKTAW